MAALDDAIATLTQQVSADTDVENSAVTVLNSIPKMIADAVAAAIAAGATPAQLQAITDVGNKVQANAATLAAAVANVNGQPTPPPPAARRR